MRIKIALATAIACFLPSFSIAEPSISRAPAVLAPVPVAPAAQLRGVPSMSLAARLSALAPGANPRVIDLAIQARECAIASGDATGAGERLAVIDYSMPSTQKRLWVFDLRNQRVLYNELVAHGQGSGDNYARAFSNNEGSHQTSIGLFRTAEVYNGKNGYSLRMDGLDPGFNDNARPRAIVMHGAAYVDAAMVPKMGRIGRSQGCPAVRANMAREIIDTLKGGQFVFSYYPDQKWLRGSPMFACNARGGRASVASR